MNHNEIAKSLLAYRNSTSLMMPGPLAAEIGSEAVQEAFRLGWLQPDMESGYIQLTTEATRLHQMRELAEQPGVDKGTPPAMEAVSPGRAFAMNHAGRRLHESYLGYSGSSTSGGAPGSGQPANPPAATQQPPNATMNRPGSDYMVGEDVLVAEEGKSYSAKVQSKNADGTYKLSFGPNRPAQQDRLFRKEEMQRVAAGQPGQPSQPGQPAPIVQ